MKSALKPWRRACVAAVGAAGLTIMATTGGSLTAQAATRAAARHSCGVSAVVHLHGRTYHVHMSGRFGIVPMRGHKIRVNQPAGRTCHASGGAKAAQVSGALTYGGGPVATSPVVYLDFWGSQWDSDSNGVEQYMQSLFSGLGDASDSWSTSMTQYTDGSGNPVAFTGSVLGGTWVDDSAPAPQSASQADLAAEAQNAASYFGVSGPNVDIFVVSPSGTNPDGFPNTGFCAWHDWNGTTAYTNMPYVLDAGSSCGANSVQGPLDGFSIVGGHEYAEAVTDPEPPTGWTDQSNGEEIGDLCAWQNLQAISFDTGTFAMQPLWSDNDNGCVQ